MEYTKTSVLNPNLLLATVLLALAVVSHLTLFHWLHPATGSPDMIRNEGSRGSLAAVPWQNHDNVVSLAMSHDSVMCPVANIRQEHGNVLSGHRVPSAPATLIAFSNPGKQPAPGPPLRRPVTGPARQALLQRFTL